MLYKFRISDKATREWHWIEDGSIVKSLTDEQAREIKKLQAYQAEQTKAYLKRV